MRPERFVPAYKQRRIERQQRPRVLITGESNEKTRRAVEGMNAMLSTALRCKAQAGS